jgi:hypothetical protein
MNIGSMSLLEYVILAATSMILFVATAWLFKFITKNSKTYFFAFLAMLSFSGYLYIHPECASVGIYQIICTAEVALLFNFIFFILGLIVAFVLNKILSTVDAVPLIVFCYVIVFLC